MPMMPSPGITPGNPNMKSGFRPTFAMQDAVWARSMWTAWPCVIRIPLALNATINAGVDRIAIFR